MTTYHFALCNEDGFREDLGFIDLKSDEDAISFAAEVMQDILRDHSWGYSASVMVITDNKRIVRATGFKTKSEEQQRIIH